MRIKQFEAKSMREALSMIKQEFGPDAVIVSAKNVRKAGGLLGLSGNSGVVVVAAIDDAAANSTPFEADPRQGGKVPPGVSPLAVSGLFQNIQSLPHTAGFMGKTTAPAVEKRSRVSPMRPRNRKDLYVLYHQLLSQGVKESVALRLVSELQHIGSFSLSSAQAGTARYLAGVIEDMGVTQRRFKIRRNQQQIVVLAGPTGVGKTTTLAKLVGFAQSSRLRGRIGWLSLDNYKVGYLAQAKVYEAIMGVPVALVSNNREFRGALQRLHDKDLIFVDTPGIGPRDEERLSTVHSVLADQQSMEVCLLMGAATRNPEIQGIIERFSLLPITSLLFTKTDESRSFGDLLNTLLETHLPLSYFTSGQGIPDDIEIATSEKLMGLILAQETAQKIWKGPPEVLAEKVSLFEELLVGAAREDRRGIELKGPAGLKVNTRGTADPYGTGISTYR